MLGFIIQKEHIKSDLICLRELRWIKCLELFYNFLIPGNTIVIWSGNCAKRWSCLLYTSHPLPIQKCSIDYELDHKKNRIHVFCTVKTEGKTGVEMEALTGVQVTLLTIYDMCKACRLYTSIGQYLTGRVWLGIQDLPEKIIFTLFL